MPSQEKRVEFDWSRVQLLEAIRANLDLSSGGERQTNSVTLACITAQNAFLPMEYNPSLCHSLSQLLRYFVIQER